MDTINLAEDRDFLIKLLENSFTKEESIAKTIEDNHLRIESQGTIKHYPLTEEETKSLSKVNEKNRKMLEFVIAEKAYLELLAQLGSDKAFAVRIDSISSPDLIKAIVKNKFTPVWYYPKEITESKAVKILTVIANLKPELFYIDVEESGENQLENKVNLLKALVESSKSHYTRQMMLTYFYLVQFAVGITTPVDEHLVPISLEHTLFRDKEVYQAYIDQYLSIEENRSNLLDVIRFIKSIPLAIYSFRVDADITALSTKNIIQVDDSQGQHQISRIAYGLIKNRDLIYYLIDHIENTPSVKERFSLDNTYYFFKNQFKEKVWFNQNLFEILSKNHYLEEVD